MRVLASIIFLSLLFASCGSKVKPTTMVVASKTADCEGVAPQKCMLVKETADSDWTYFYNSIEGFEYEEGYEYVIDVKKEELKDVPADAPSVKYVMVKLVSKTQKESEGIEAFMKTPEAPTAIRLVGKVLDKKEENIGKGGAEDKIMATVLKLEVTSSEFAEISARDTVHCELVKTPAVAPEVGREYVFTAKVLHPSHALGVYMLETDVQDLVR